MSSPHFRAPHASGAFGPQTEAVNAALLIDFDNVTMGMRSDLSKELSTLLNSDIIKGKVTVQRAYADWRRYPQYIVPLSENSVDLIFAPAYGSSKKNATDIRMAIDGMELVFIRPEIGTYILLTGDSDFSSLVLKLKEYGKYVIGVGIQESSSDILVQNCDEYYSYTSLTGLKKTTDSDNKPVDPWILVEQAAARMASRDDVMRSDRLKQVMIEIDPTFDEGNFGFSKFSRFLSEAGSRDLVQLRKLENGQYEVLPADGGASDGDKGRGSGKKASGRSKTRDQEERGSERKGRGRGKKDSHGEDRKERRTRGSDAKAGKAAKAEDPSDGAKGKKHGPTDSAGDDDPLKKAYGLLQQALSVLREGDGAPEAVRDSDLKRRMLRLDPAFDEGELGFGKFSRFLRQAHDHEVIDLEKRDGGTYQVAPRGAGTGAAEDAGPETPASEAPESEATESAPEVEAKAEDGGVGGSGKEKAESPPQRGVGVRRGGSRFKKDPDGPPPFLEGQVVGGKSGKEGSQQAALALGDEASGSKGSAGRSTRGRRGRAPKTDRQDGKPMALPEGRDIGSLGLPTGPAAVIRYLTNSYKGVGRKTAEKVVNEFGPDLFTVLHESPSRLSRVVGANRADQLVEAWKIDLARRLETTGADGEEQDPKADSKSQAPTEGERSKRRTRKGTRRSRGGSGKKGD
jgi:uncharacterized protein (TIGR00288 family)